MSWINSTPRISFLDSLLKRLSGRSNAVYVILINSLELLFFGMRTIFSNVFQNVEIPKLKNHIQISVKIVFNLIPHIEFCDCFQNFDPHIWGGGQSQNNTDMCYKNVNTL